MHMLMRYIINYSPLARQPGSDHNLLFEVSLTRDTTPLDELLARRKGLYRHRTTQRINTKTNIHAPNGIQTRDPSYQASKTYALDRANHSPREFRPVSNKITETSKGRSWPDPGWSAVGKNVYTF
jgi:hypothetical protein